MKRSCFFCDGTGQRCQCCGESAAVCEGQCDEEHGGLADCEECQGTGVASADLKAQEEKLPAKKPAKRRKPGRGTT